MIKPSADASPMLYRGARRPADRVSDQARTGRQSENCAQARLTISPTLLGRADEIIE